MIFELDLERMGHKVLWEMMLWGGTRYKPYVFMRDHERNTYLARRNDDGSITVL